MTKQGKRAKRLIASLAVAAALALCAPVAALADDALGDVDTPAVSASRPLPLRMPMRKPQAMWTRRRCRSPRWRCGGARGQQFCDKRLLARAEGSNRSIDGEYRATRSLSAKGVGQAAQLIAVNNQVVAYIPPAMAQQFSLDLEDAQTQTQLKQLFCALDAGQSSGSGTPKRHLGLAFHFAANL